MSLFRSDPQERLRKRLDRALRIYGGLSFPSGDVEGYAVRDQEHHYRSMYGLMLDFHKWDSSTPWEEMVRRLREPHRVGPQRRLVVSPTSKRGSGLRTTVGLGCS